MATIELVTAEELYLLGPEARFELIDGELVEYPLHGALHGMALAQLATYVGTYVRDKRLGTIYLGRSGTSFNAIPIRFWRRTSPSFGKIVIPMWETVSSR